MLSILPSQNLNPGVLDYINISLNNSVCLCLNPSTESVQNDKRNREGTFFSFGDSVSNAFFSSLSSGPYNGLCKVAFAACRPVYHWVYDMHGYWGDGVKSPREPLPDEQDYDHDRVISDVKKVSPSLQRACNFIGTGKNRKKQSFLSLFYSTPVSKGTDNTRTKTFNS